MVRGESSRDGDGKGTGFRDVAHSDCCDRFLVVGYIYCEQIGGFGGVEDARFLPFTKVGNSGG